MSDLFAFGLDDDSLRKEGKFEFKRLDTEAVYEGSVIATPRVELNLNSGNMQIVMPVAPLDSDGQPQKPTLRQYLTLPWKTPTALLEMADLPATYQADKLAEKKRTVPKTMFTLVGYARAVLGTDEIPDYPHKDKAGEIEEGAVIFNGEVLEGGWEDADDIRFALDKKVQDFFVNRLEKDGATDPQNWEVDEETGVPSIELESFIDDRFYFTVEDYEATSGNRKGEIFQRIGKLLHELPAGATRGEI